MSAMKMRSILVGYGVWGVECEKWQTTEGKKGHNAAGVCVRVL